MLSKAEEYLSFLTDGNYQRIHFRESGSGFLVERKDHTIFEANELSQATTEQLYVAIRLAFGSNAYMKTISFRLLLMIVLSTLMQKERKK